MKKILILLSLLLISSSCKKDPIFYDVTLNQSSGGQATVNLNGAQQKGTSIVFTSTGEQKVIDNTPLIFTSTQIMSF